MDRELAGLADYLGIDLPEVNPDERVSPEMVLYNITDGDIVKAEAVRHLPRERVYRWVLGAVAVQQRDKSKRDQEREEEEAAHLGD